MIGATAQRPWPLPPGPWALAMRWHQLLFMHWPVRPEELRRHIPAPLVLDTFDGRAWIGVVPFRMAGVRPRLTPPLPWLSAFPELNVRTYVTIDGKPGVWFFSLDAGNPLAVRTARYTFHLPYYDARLSSVRTGQEIAYSSGRTHHGAPPAELEVRYRPTGPVSLARAGGIEAWLTERYCLYAGTPSGRVWRGDIHHTPWPLQPAEAEIGRNTMAAPLRLALPADPPLLQYAERLEVVAWLPVVVRAGF